MMRTRLIPTFCLAIGIVALTTSCGGGGVSTSAAEPAVSLSASSLTFASRTIGTTSSAQTVLLTNTGDATLSITSISTSGDFAATQSCVTIVVAGGNCTISVTFTPTAAGSRNGSLSISDNAAVSTQTVSLTGAGEAFSIQISPAAVTATQDGEPASLTVTLNRVAGNNTSVSLSVSALSWPASLTTQPTDPGTGDSGSIAFSAPGVAAGTYSLNVNATDGVTTATAPLNLTVAILATVQNSVDTSLGINGQLQQFMSTSFQAAEWADQFFPNFPDVTPLTNLGPQHIRVQVVSEAVPMKANSNPQQSTDWDFTMLDSFMQPILSAADHSPEFQIAVAPGWMNYSNGQFDITDHLNDFVQYSVNLVEYYNAGGFDWGGKHFQSPSTGQYKVTWWGLFNEYNINGLTPDQYVQLYNAVVPAMLAVDQTIRISALELSDYDYQNGDPRNNLPTFVEGVRAHVDIVSTHFYASCNQADPDTDLFGAVASFTNDVTYFYQELSTRPDLANTPVWVTENNVNADYDKGGGISACNGTPFVTDQRGTSAFFAAWRPYVFSQLGKAGNQALFHWAYAADKQYGEVDYGTGDKYLSYWVDYFLGQYFPSPPGASILSFTDTEPSSAETVEVLATRNTDNSVVVMLANHAVQAPTDDNGPGDPRTIIVDISSLGPFSSATELILDATTDAAAQPNPVPAGSPPGPRMTVNLNGYGVAFIDLKP